MYLGHPEFIEFLIQNGAYVGAWDLGGDTALHVASKCINEKPYIFNGRIHVVQSNFPFSGTEAVAYELVRYGANVNAANFGISIRN